MKIALIGNPNSGKTSLFNALTGSRQKVGNWPGVTIDKKTGEFSYQHEKMQIIDLPGVYDLELQQAGSGSLDEKVARDYLSSQDADCVVNVIDASNLERNLYLTLQIAELKKPMVVALNMMDIANAHGLKIDIPALEAKLGVPVIPIIARKRQGLDVLKQQLLAYKQAPQHTNTSLLEQLHDMKNRLSAEYQESADLICADARYRVIAHIVAATTATIKTRRRHFTELLDKVVLNRFLGIPIFLLVMYLMFEFSITIGGAIQPLFDQGSRAIFIDGISHVGYLLHIPSWITAIFADGIGLGINTVLTFIPQIGGLFLFLSFIEDSGYMNRAAFVMDRTMQAIGLPGKSFIPLIVGFGCNVPAIMATRTLDSRRDRLLTIMMSPFMSCGARLAIFAVFASSFFPKGGGIIVFLLYIIGIAIALLTGLIVRSTLLKGEPAPFILEIPPYHVPQFKNLLIHTWQKLKFFVCRAGKLIIPVCLIVGSLNSIDWHGRVYPSGSPHSILASVSQVVTPVLKPIGIQEHNWPATVGLVTGTLAKEVVVGTLNTLYSQGQTNTAPVKSFNLWQNLKAAGKDTLESLRSLSAASFANPFTANEAQTEMTGTAMGQMVVAFGSLSAAFAYLLFVLLYVPCISTVAAIKREAGSGWAWLSTIWSFLIAYVAATLCYQLSNLDTDPTVRILWSLGMLGILGLFVFLLRHYAIRQALKQTNPLMGFKK